MKKHLILPVMSEVRFRTFVEEATITAGGWHDGSSIHVVYGHTGDELVVTHEEVHHRIFTECPDGHLLHTLLFAQREHIPNKCDLESASRYNKLISNIFENSEIAQEIFATYISVKHFPVYEHADQLARYPAAYRHYFNQISPVLDEPLGSSYLQYLVAWNIAVVVFSSPFPNRFYASLPDIVTELLPIETPNLRVVAVLNALKCPLKMKQLIKELQSIGSDVALSMGGDAWDLTCEHDWIKAPRGIRHEVEFALSSRLREWIPEACEIEFCDGSADIAAMHVSFAASVGLSITTLPAIRSSAEDSAQVLVRAIGAVESKIENFPLPPTLEDHNLLWFLDPSHCMAIGGASVLDETIDLVTWQNVPKPNGGDSVFAKISDSMFEEITWKNSPLDIRPNIDAVVLGINDSEEMKSWFWRMPLIIPQQTQEICRTVGLLRFHLFWYLHGNYISWIDALTKPLYCCTVTVQSTSIAGATCVVKVLRHQDEYHTAFMRIFTKRAAAQFHPYEMLLIEKGDIIVEKSTEEIKMKVVSAFNLCSMMWRQL